MAPQKDNTHTFAILMFAKPNAARPKLNEIAAIAGTSMQLANPCSTSAAKTTSNRKFGARLVPGADGDAAGAGRGHRGSEPGR